MTALDALAVLERAVESADQAELKAIRSAALALADACLVRMMESAAPSDENLDVREAARRLGCSASLLYKRADKLPFALRVGSRLVFSARGLERWNKQQQMGGGR